MPIATIIFWLLWRELHTRQLDNDLQTPIPKLLLQINLVVFMAEELCLAAITIVAFLCRQTSFPLVERILFARLRMRNATSSFKFPIDGLFRLDSLVIFPSAIFECFVVIIVMRRIELRVIG